MPLRQRTGSTPCIRCNELVAVTDRRCWRCGQSHPALFGFLPALRRWGRDLGFVPLVIGVCGLLYLVSLGISFATGREVAPTGGFLRVLAPNAEVLFLLGGTGALPVVGYGRWWTVLSAAWLHGSLLHIVFNMLWIRMLAPAVADAYGVGRLVVIYTVAAIAGGLATTLVAAYFPFAPGPLRGATLSIGASGAVFGLLAAMLHYGHRTGRRAVGQQAWTLAVVLFLFGLLMPGVDNWGHLGGFLGGYAMALALDPLRPERGWHLVAALFCLAASAASIAASVIHGIGLVRT
jgi:rhomboid protease GluP